LGGRLGRQAVAVVGDDDHVLVGLAPTPDFDGVGVRVCQRVGDQVLEERFEPYSSRSDLSLAGFLLCDVVQNYVCPLDISFGWVDEPKNLKEYYYHSNYEVQKT
jgi:hypothetical protein